MRLVLVNACKRHFFRMIRSWSNDLRCGIEFNKRIETLDCSSGIKTVLRLYGGFQASGQACIQVLASFYTSSAEVETEYLIVYS